MELLPLAFASGWASGLNAYATVLLVVMGALTLVEFVADKIRVKQGWLALRRWMARDAVPEAA